MTWPEDFTWPSFLPYLPCRSSSTAQPRVREVSNWSVLTILNPTKSTSNIKWKLYSSQKAASYPQRRSDRKMTKFLKTMSPPGLPMLYPSYFSCCSEWGFKCPHPPPASFWLLSVCVLTVRPSMNWTWYSRCGLTSQKLNERQTCLIYYAPMSRN